MAAKAKPVNLVELGKDHWRIRVFVGRGVDGRPKWASKNVRGTLKEAKAAVAAFKTDLDRQDATSHPGSVADLLDRWLDDIGVTRSVYTMREHTRTVEKTLKPAIGAVRLDKLTPLHMDDLYRDLLGRGLSPASVRRVHSVLSAALNRGCQVGATEGQSSPTGLPTGTREVDRVRSCSSRCPAAHGGRRGSGPCTCGCYSSGRCDWGQERGAVCIALVRR